MFSIKQFNPNILRLNHDPPSLSFPLSPPGGFLADGLEDAIKIPHYSSNFNNVSVWFGAVRKGKYKTANIQKELTFLTQRRSQGGDLVTEVAKNPKAKFRFFCKSRKKPVKRLEGVFVDGKLLPLNGTNVLRMVSLVNHSCSRACKVKGCT